MDICTACLCTERKLYLLNDCNIYYNIYAEILNEIAVYDLSEVCIRVCWECYALLNRFQRFKDQVKQCYMKLFLQRGSELKTPLTKKSNLQIENVCNINCGENFTVIKIKDELEDDFNMETFDFGQESDINTDILKNEVIEEFHREPETFVNNLDVHSRKVKKKNSVKKFKKKGKIKSKVDKLSKKAVKSSKRKQKQKPDEPHDFSDTASVLEDSKHNEIGNGNTEPHKSEIEEYGCNDCDTFFYNKPDLLDHIKAVHINTMPEKQMETDKVRAKRAPRATKEELAEKPQCKECGKMFSSRKTYRYHLTVLHEGQNQYPCPRCGKVYQWKSNLGRHMRSHKARDSGELYCEICDKRFASIATYRQHLRISRRHVNESEFTFKCNDCGKKFVNKTRLRDHIDWEHLKKIKFKCHLCNKPFKCHTSLYVHMQNVHRDKEKKDNLCHVCGKSYQNAAKLKYHIVAMHTTETPYQCSQCTAAFGWYSSLYRHIREVHYKMKLQVKKTKKGKKLTNDATPSILAPQQMMLPPLHLPGPP